MHFMTVGTFVAPISILFCKRLHHIYPFNRPKAFSTTALTDDNR